MSVLSSIDWKDRRVHIEIGLLVVLALSTTAFIWLRSVGQTVQQALTVAEHRLDRATSELSDRIESPLPSGSSRSEWKLRELPDVSGVLREFEIAERKSGVHLEEVECKSGGASGRERFEIVGTGRTAGLCAFLSHLEQQHYLLVPDTIQLLGVVGKDVRFALAVSSFSMGSGE